MWDLSFRGHWDLQSGLVGETGVGEGGGMHRTWRGTHMLLVGEFVSWYSVGGLVWFSCCGGTLHGKVGVSRSDSFLNKSGVRLGCTFGGVHRDDVSDRILLRVPGVCGGLRAGRGAPCLREVSDAMRGALVALAASWNISWRSPSAWRVEVCSCGDLMPWRVSVRHADAAITWTWSSNVTFGLVRYLCLKKAAPEMLVAHVVGDDITSTYSK
jgi:hypothetical protein